MKLYDLIEDKISTHIENCDVVNITDDSRKIEKGSLFVCVKGGSFDGHDFAQRAIEIGAVAVVTDHDVGVSNQIIENTRKF